MTPADVERVFGRSRLQIATGRHVEVFREVARSGEERRYTKRFLVTEDVDFRPWTEREYLILVRLGRLHGAPVAKALDLLAPDETGTPSLQTRDAGATLDQWATLVPLRRGATALRNVFDDCANWWALARQCMVALDALHALGFVHLDLKPDNICIPWAPAGAGRPLPGQPLAPRVKALALVDVAFSLVPEVDLPGPLPLLRQPEYEYQSPRLLHALEEGRRGSLAATRALDWRCDFFSLAAMLWRYLPELDDAPGWGWDAERHGQAMEFVQQLLDVHAAPVGTMWPHRQLIGLAALRLREPDLQAALQAGCTFDPEREVPLDTEPTPPTRIADHAPRQVDPEPPADLEGDRVASAPMPLDERRREPTAAPLAPMPGRDVRREPSASAPMPLGEARRDPSVSAPMPLGETRATSSPPPFGEVRREPTVRPILATPTAAAPTRTPMAPTPTPAGAPAVAAIYSTPADLYEPTQPPPPDTAPGAWPEPDPEPGSAAAQADGAHAAPAAPTRAGRRRQVAIAIAATGILGAAAITALWLSIGRTLGPIATVAIPLPSASETASLAEPPSPPSRPGASAPTVVAAAAQATTDASPPPMSEAASTPASEVGASARPPAANVENPPVPAERSAPASDDLDALAAELLQRRIPGVVPGAERQLARVLAVAAGASELRRRGDVRSAAQAMRSAAPQEPFAAPVRGDEARRLNEAALVAYWRHDDVDDAVRLQTRAFAAHPFDSEVVGNLAFLRLKEHPPQAEAARQLAMHALTLNDPYFPSGRIEDWTAFAIASALTGHDAEARNAWFASMALASDLQHQCNNAVRAESIYGDRLRPSVQAMLQRARSSAAYGRCEAALAAQPAHPKRQGTAAQKTPAKAAPRPAAKSQAKPVQRARGAIP